MSQILRKMDLLKSMLERIEIRNARLRAGIAKKKRPAKKPTNLSIIWPAPNVVFTIKALWKANPEFVPITLRVKLNQAIEKGQVKIVGVITPKRGRPIKQFKWIGSKKV